MERRTRGEAGRCCPGSLTPARQRVLTVLQAQPRRVLGAYDILEILATTGSRPAPMSVYRALEYLMGVGLVHRIASLNGFVACHAGDRGAGHAAQFLICRACRTVIELDGPGVARALEEACAAAWFAPEGAAVVEVTGVCRRCRETRGDEDDGASCRH